MLCPLWGFLQVSFYIQTHADATEEGDETLSVVLSDAVNIAIADGTGTVTIVDTPTISVGDAVIQEGQAADVDVSLSHVCSRPVTAQWINPPGSATVTGGDYDPDSGDLTWQPGDLVISIHMETNADSLEEGDEQFLVSLTGSQNALIADPSGTVTIIDTPEASVGDSAIQEGGAAEITITLSGVSSIPTSVSWATVDGTAEAATSDYGGNFVGAAGAVAFAPGQTTISFYIQTTVDGVLEGDETFSVVLADPEGLTIGDGTGVVTILDTPTISVGDSAAIEGTDAEVEVCLSHASSSPVSVAWATADGTAGSTAAQTDYVAGAGVITWAAGETCVTLTVRTVADELPEGEVGEQFLIVLSDPSNGIVAVGVGTVTVLEPTVDRVQTVGEGGEGGKGGKGMGSKGMGSKGTGISSKGGGSKGMGESGGSKGMGGGSGKGEFGGSKGGGSKGQAQFGSQAMGGGSSKGEFGGKGMGGGSGKGEFGGKGGPSFGKQVSTGTFDSAYASHDSAAHSGGNVLVVFGLFCVAGLGLVVVRARKRVGALIGTDHRYDALKSFKFAPATSKKSTFSMLTGSPTERTPLTVSPVRPVAGTGGRGGDSPSQSELGAPLFGGPVLV